MPIGDPRGGDFYDLGRGRIKRVWLVVVPVRDLDEAMEYYQEVLGMPVRLDARKDNWVEVGAADPLARIALQVPDKDDRRQPGGDTGLVLATDSLFDLHRRLVDEGVEFLVKPERRPWGGLLAVFQDLYGNRFTVVEDRAEQGGAELPAPEKEERSSVRIKTVITPD